MDINLTLSPYPAFAGQIKVAVYAADNPGAEISSQTFSAPHTSPRAVSFVSLDRKVHIVKTIALPSTVIHDFIYNPMDTSYDVIFPIIHKIGDGQPNTPTAGTNTYRNSALKKSTGVAKTFYVERRSIGTMRPTSEITVVQTDPNYGFDLAQVGDVWMDEEVFVVHVLPEKITTPINDTVVGKWFDGGVDITGATVNYDAATHLRKLLRSRGSGALQTFNLPAAAAAPIGYVIGFSTYGSGYTNFKAVSPSANIELGGTIGTEIQVGQNTILMLMYDGTHWQIISKQSSVSLAVSDNPDLNDSNTLATTKATKTLADRIRTIAYGKTNLGNIGGGDPVYEISFLNPNSYDYIVLGSFKSNSSSADHGKDNSITWAWYKDETTPNTKFKLIVQELAAETQNVEFCWEVVRI